MRLFGFGSKKVRKQPEVQTDTSVGKAERAETEAKKPVEAKTHFAGTTHESHDAPVGQRGEARAATP
jgi:hypothetical protein